jgi:hypothetical protein
MDSTAGAARCNGRDILLEIGTCRFHPYRLAGNLRLLPYCFDSRFIQTGGTVNYLPPFDLIRRMVEVSTIRGELRVSLSYDDFIRILRMMISGVEVDEEWYLREHEDIARAIRDGAVQSAKQHFNDDGYFEGRLPFPMPVDETWYLEQYADVAESVRKGVVTSGQQHFSEDGYREGRLPHAL